MSITLVTPRESELQKQVIELAESLRNLGWEFELYKTGARNTHQKLLDEIREFKAENENLRAYAKHERSLGAEAFAMENLDLTQQVEILKAKLAEAEKRLHMLLMPVPAKDVTALDVCKVVSERAMEIIQLLKETP